MKSLTAVQQEAVDYSLRTKRPNDHRVIRKASRMVRDFCKGNGYTQEQTAECVRDMWDVVRLERNAQ
jgi:hypothetical protein